MSTPLDKVFTLASDTPGASTGPITLLFTSLENTIDITAPTIIPKIINDPLFYQIMGGGVVHFENPGGNTPVLGLSNSIAQHGIERLEIAEPGEQIIGVYSNGHSSISKVINLREAYDHCTLPHKIILGCVECYRQGRTPSRQCDVRRLKNTMGWNIITAHERLKSRKTTLAGFTYVSPQLTKPEYFQTTFRTSDEHDFSMIEEHSDRIKGGLRERGRLRQFKQTVCPTCLVQKACEDQANKHQRKYCYGPFEYANDEAAAEEILKEYTIPFTDYQLIYLLRASGELIKRYRNCKYWATFHYNSSRKELQFGLCRLTTGEFEKLDMPFKELKEFLIKYRGIKPTKYKSRTISTLTKALLLELAQMTWSPTRVSRWRTVSYDSLGITYYHTAQILTLHFKFNNFGGYYKGWVLPWNITATTFEDIYGETTELRILKQNSHPLSHRNF